MTPHALPVHVRTIRIDAIEAVPSGGSAPETLLRVHGTLEDRRPRGLPEWFHRWGPRDGEAGEHPDGANVVHHMEVTLVVRHPESVITAIEGRMLTVPYPGVCPEILPALDSLVGVAIDRGFARAVNQRLGRERGCSHVTALILAMGPVVRQGAGAAFGFQPAATGGARPWFLNSCHAWRDGGPLQAWLTAQPPSSE